MAKQLGIGVRVFIGWADEQTEIERGYREHLLKKGVIFDGPLKPGGIVPDGDGGFNVNFTGHNIWGVSVDSGEEICIAEYLLTPIDDDDNVEQIETHQKQTEEV